MLASMTFDDGDPIGLSEKIVEYFRLKDIEIVNVIFSGESGNRDMKQYSKNSFDMLREGIRDSIFDEGVNFYIDIPEIKTSFEEFSYGIEANSEEVDFQEFFEEFED